MKIFFVFFMIIASFIYGFATERYKIFPFNLIKNTKNFLVNNLSKESSIFKVCKIESLKIVPKNSIAFIGHAYGNPGTATSKSFLSPNAEAFIKIHATKLQSIIFTGDVFSIPSINKYKRLRNISGKDLEIHIAPGNHDVLRPDSRDIFQISEFGQQEYPYLKNLDKTSLIIDDSIRTNSHLSKLVVSLINSTQNNKVIIARHNPPVRELLSLTNSTAGVSKNLEEMIQIIPNFDKDKKYFWVIGDSGAIPNLPRLSCLKYHNHTFLLNGLGQTIGDSVLLYKDENFFEFIL